MRVGEIGAADNDWRFTFPVSKGPTWPMAGAAVGAGVLADQAVRAGVIGAATPVLVLLTSVALWRSGRLATIDSRVLVALGPVFTVWLAVRTSAWLIPLDVLAAFALLTLGCSFATGGVSPT